MSAWPWMKGHSVAIADAIPVNPQVDHRPSVKDLIQRHRSKIDELRDLLKEDALFDHPAKHDDLWLLRFLLSHKGKLKAALKAAQHTLQFRKEQSLDEQDVRDIHIGHDLDRHTSAAQSYQNCCDPATFRFVVHERCVVSYIQWAGFDQPKILRQVKPEEWLPCFAFITEWSHQWCDYLSRTTGRLTKHVRIVDLDNISLTKNCLPKSCLRDAIALNAMEDVYPQVLQNFYLAQAPIWIEGPWKTIRPLVPKRVLEKFDFLEPLKKEKDRQKLLKWISLERLPERYGGKLAQWPDDTPPPAINVPVGDDEEMTDEVET